MPQFWVSTFDFDIGLQLQFVDNFCTFVCIDWSLNWIPHCCMAMGCWVVLLFVGWVVLGASWQPCMLAIHVTVSYIYVDSPQETVYWLALPSLLRYIDIQDRACNIKPKQSYKKREKIMSIILRQTPVITRVLLSVREKILFLASNNVLYWNSYKY